MMLFLRLWPTAKEETSSLFQISYAKPVFPLQSINPWSPVSAKHNCILSWALISKIEIISQTASAQGPLPCCHVLQQSSLTEWFRTAGIWLCWAVRWLNLLFGTWENRISMELLTPLSTVGFSSTSRGKCLCWCLFIPCQEKVSAGARGHRPCSGAFKALEIPVLLGSSAFMHLQAHLPTGNANASSLHKTFWELLQFSCAFLSLPTTFRAHHTHTSSLNLRSKVEASENLLHRWCLTYNSHEDVSATRAKYISKVLKIMTECALPASHHCIVIGDKYESIVNFTYLTSFSDYQ